MKRRRELTILCRKCRNPIKVTVTLEIGYYTTNNFGDIYKVRIVDVSNKNCKKCGREIKAIGPLIGSSV